MLDKEKVLIIKAGGGYFNQGVEAEGYGVESPYKGRGIVLRILREVIFRMPFSLKKLWYNKHISEKNYDYILVWDVLITSDFLNWLSKEQPTAQLNFVYGNMVGKSRHLMPSQIPTNYRVWSYDKGDSEKFHLNLFHSNPYFKCFVKPLQTPKYDVFYVGSDKGRAEYILSLEKEMLSVGLRTNFVIVKDGRLSRNKSYYKPALPYDAVTDIVAESKAVLNIIMPGQVGITLRDLEALLIGVKLITNNENIVKADFYHPDNVYILRGTNIDGLKEFLEKPMCHISNEIKSKCDFSAFVEEIISDER